LALAAIAVAREATYEPCAPPVEPADRFYCAQLHDPTGSF
jgi:hypothetical protein